MKKSLIAVAVAGLFAAPAAMAVETSFGGEIDVAIQRVDNGDESWNQGNNTHSRFWADAREDIGNGNTVRGHLEFDWGVNGYHGGNSANGGNGTSVNNRNSFIGIQGANWGEFRFGTQENIFEATGYNVDPYHGAAGPGGNIVNGMGQTGVFGNSAVCNGSNLGCRRTDSTLTYISPNLSGLTFQVDYTLEGPTGTGPSTGDKWNELSFGGRYDGKFGEENGWRVYGAAIQVKGADLLRASTGAGTLPLALSDSSKDEGLRVGAGVTFGPFAVDFIFEKLSYETNVAGASLDLERDGWWLGGSWTIPTGKFAAGYQVMGERDGNFTTNTDSGGSHLAVGYYHTLSKASQLYFIYEKLDNDANAGYNLQSMDTAAVGKDPSAFSLGMILLF